MSSDKEIEAEIIAKGLTAPRVTMGLIESRIAWELYTTGDELARNATAVVGTAYKSHEYPEDKLKCLTLCVLVLNNGFTVTGESAPASSENFDPALGRKVARQNAVNKVWMLEGYLLKQRLYDEASTQKTEDRS